MVGRTCASMFGRPAQPLAAARRAACCAQDLVLSILEAALPEQEAWQMEAQVKALRPAAAHRSYMVSKVLRSASWTRRLRSQLHPQAATWQPNSVCTRAVKLASARSLGFAVGRRRSQVTPMAWCFGLLRRSLPEPCSAYWGPLPRIPVDDSCLYQPVRDGTSSTLDPLPGAD